MVGVSCATTCSTAHTHTHTVVLAPLVMLALTSLGIAVYLSPPLPLPSTLLPSLPFPPFPPLPSLPSLPSLSSPPLLSPLFPSSRVPSMSKLRETRWPETWRGVGCSRCGLSVTTWRPAPPTSTSCGFWRLKTSTPSSCLRCPRNTSLDWCSVREWGGRAGSRRGSGGPGRRRGRGEARQGGGKKGECGKMGRKF